MMMNQTKWELKSQPTDEEITNLQNELESSRLFAVFCLQRGIHSSDELQSFIHPEIGELHNPYDLYDMEKAKERIEQAIIENEKITIYGDYDADGVTSTSILVETLIMIGANVDYYIPNRFAEGYGPHIDSFQKIINRGTNLIITVDNGVQGHDSIDFANDQGVDVIVTDHHELPEALPEAYAVVHPRHPLGNYPFNDLSGAGVAFKVATAILDEIPFDLMDLAAIGTVADLVSLTDENRVLVKFGLTAMKQAERPGILSLLQISDTKPGDVDETDIGFRIGPRLNAAGRMGDAEIAVKLLISQDMETAKPLAEELDRLNQTRKQYVEDITEEITAKIDQYQSDYVNVISGEDWHEGVIGIVASRIVELTGKPTVILSIDEEEGVAKGSGRSVEGVNLFEVLNHSNRLMQAFGGHHMAAGMTVTIENLELLRQEINVYVGENYSKEEREKSVTVDVEASLGDITIESINEIKRLAPFGTDNTQPKLVLPGVQAKDMRKIGANKTHLKAVLEDSETSSTVDAVGFGHGEIVDNLGSQPIIDVICTANVNEWNGNRKPQVMIEFINVSKTQIIDQRSRRFPTNIYDKLDSAYIFFTKQVYHAATQVKGNDDNFYLVESEKEPRMFEENNVVFVECPPNAETIKNILSENNFQTIYAIFFSFEEVYLNGLGSRKEFEKTYHYVMSHKNIDYQHKRQVLADYLKINLNLLNFIILVFMEVDYVKIEDGLLQPNPNPKSFSLKETGTYKKRQSLMQMEKQLLYSSISELTTLLNSWLKVEE